MAKSKRDQALIDVGSYEGEYKDGKYHGQGIRFSLFKETQNN